MQDLHAEDSKLVEHPVCLCQLCLLRHSSCCRVSSGHAKRNCAITVEVKLNSRVDVSIHDSGRRRTEERSTQDKQPPSLSRAGKGVGAE